MKSKMQRSELIKVAIIAEFPLGYFADGGAGRGGGQAATWLPQLAEAWKDEKDFDLHWCVLDRSVEEPRSEIHLNQTFHRIPDRGVTLGLMLGRWPQRLAYRRVLNEIEPDIIHCWGTENLHGSAIPEYRGPAILSMQGVITTYFETGDLSGWRWRLFRYWESRTIAAAAVITSESRWGLEQVARIDSTKPSRKIEYGVFPSYFEVEHKPAPGEPRVIFVGGLNRLKGVDILLEGLRRHRDRKWTMVFAGGGYLDGALRELNDPKIEMLGTITMNQVQRQMAAAWVLVLPSRADTSPNVVKEARVIGLPVVVSPHGGHAEYVEEGVDGMVIASEEPEEWMKALDNLCADYERCLRMGGANHERYREHFHPENTAHDFGRLYRELS